METMKHILLVIALLFSPNVLAENVYVPVLMYHDLNNDVNDQYSVAPSKFKAQMRWLSSQGYRAIPLIRINNARPKDIVITFDDGYHSFIEHALPVLKELNFPVTINLVGEWIGGTIPDVTDKKALSWDDVAMLERTGLVTFGSHTQALHHYPDGIMKSTELELLNDFLNFQRNFIKHTGKLSEVIAWPFGKYTVKAVVAAQDAKFKYVLTSNKGVYTRNNYFIPRLSVERGTDITVLMNGL